MCHFAGPQEIGDYVFPEPELENVYAAWKPLDRGHPVPQRSCFFEVLAIPIPRR